MGTRDDVLVRIDEIEAELRGLFAELHDLRALVGRAAELPVAEATLAPVAPPAAAAPAPRPPTPVSTPHLSAAKRRETAIFSARILLSDGRPHDALGELERAIVAARASGDRDGLERLGAELQGIARYRPRIRDRALALAEVARTTPTDVGAAPIAHPPIAHVAPAHRPAAPAAPPGPPRRGVVDLARDWDLLGPRGFAIVGGAVTALGIILLFVLATNRGWITPTMRVAIGAVVSAVAVGVGFWVRKRYGQMQMSLGAVGAGIAGGYASLAAAAARYDLVPDWLALPLAGVIAAVAVVIAIAWSSETVAAIGLVGAALAPGAAGDRHGNDVALRRVRRDRARRDGHADRAAPAGINCSSALPRS